MPVTERRGCHALPGPDDRVYLIEYPYRAFGDHLFSAVITAILNDNGFKAYLRNPTIAHLVDCPKVAPDGPQENAVRFKCVRRHRPGLDVEGVFTVYSDLLAKFREDFNVDQEITVTRDHVPVIYYDIPEIPSVDVLIVSET